MYPATIIIELMRNACIDLFSDFSPALTFNDNLDFISSGTPEKPGRNLFTVDVNFVNVSPNFPARNSSSRKIIQ